MLGAALLAVPGLAAGKKKPKKGDREAPTITHVPPAQHDGAGPLVIEAGIVDDSGVFDPAVLVRAPGGDFERVAMQPVEGKPDTFAATVPPALLAGDIEYLIEAYDEDGNGPSRAGDEAEPLRVARVVTAPPPVETLPRPSDPVPDKPEEGDNDALLWGAGIAVGGVILLGAAAGIGLAVFALTPTTPATVAVTITSGSPITAGAAP